MRNISIKSLGPTHQHHAKGGEVSRTTTEPGRSERAIKNGCCIIAAPPPIPSQNRATNMQLMTQTSSRSDPPPQGQTEEWSRRLCLRGGAGSPDGPGSGAAAADHKLDPYGCVPRPVRTRTGARGGGQGQRLSSQRLSSLLPGLTSDGDRTRVWVGGAA